MMTYNYAKTIETDEWRTYVANLTAAELVNDNNVDALFESYSTSYTCEGSMQGSSDTFPYTIEVKANATDNMGVAGAKYYIKPTVKSSTEKSVFRLLGTFSVDNTGAMYWGFVDNNYNAIRIAFNTGSTTLEVVKIASDANFRKAYSDGSLTGLYQKTITGLDITKLNTYEIIIILTKATSETIQVVLRVNGKLLAASVQVKDSDFQFSQMANPHIGCGDSNGKLYIDRIELRPR